METKTIWSQLIQSKADSYTLTHLTKMSTLHLSTFSFTKSVPARSRILLVGLSSNNHFHLVNVPSSRVKCMDAITSSDDQTSIVRRTRNYPPSIWGYDYLQSLRSDYVGESVTKQLNELKEEVRMMFDHKVVMECHLLHQLELIDTLQRLGLSYHFEDEIWKTLSYIYSNTNYKQKQERNLYIVALEFRLLRQHGFHVPQEIFNRFMDEEGKFKSCLCDDDCKGILSLYEAAHLLVEGESILLEAINFSTAYLKEYLVKHNKDEYLSTLVNHAMKLPFHWMMIRLEVRWFIDAYERKHEDMNQILLDFAKLDFNVIQATHQEDIKYVSRWWRHMGLRENLSFIRDGLMECFLWSAGVIYEPEFGYCRRMFTEVFALILTIEDVYYVYGTLDELELFTEAVDRWDVRAIEQLPYYMKICFFALHNSINEMAFTALKETGVEVIHYMKKAWADTCKAYLLEARWYYSGYTPTLQEYMDNSWISISGPVDLVHFYCFVTNPITKDALDYVGKYPDIIRWSSIILRLADDMGTSMGEMKRVKSIHCHMHETGASNEEARDHIQGLIRETWMKMNKEVNGVRDDQLFCNRFIGIAMNLARMAQCMYQHGDGHGPDHKSVTEDRVLSLFVNPIECTSMSV